VIKGSIGVVILDRHVRRHRVMPAAAKLAPDEMSAPTFVIGAVDERVRCLPHDDAVLDGAPRFVDDR
jgi:hypothetical protein